MDVDEYINQRKKALGVQSSVATAEPDDYIQNRKMDLGLIPDTRLKAPIQPTQAEVNTQAAKDFTSNTLSKVTNGTFQQRLVSSMPKVAESGTGETIHFDPIELNRKGADFDPALLNRDRFNPVPAAAPYEPKSIAQGPVQEALIYGLQGATQPIRDIAAATPSLNFTVPEYSGADAKYLSPTQAKIAEVGGVLAGSIPGIGASYLTGGKAVANLLARTSPGASRVATEAVRGAGAGLTYGVSGEAIDVVGDTRQDGKQGLDERLKRIAIDTGLGIAGDAAIPILGAAFRGTKIAKAFDDFMTRRKTEVLEPDNPTPQASNPEVLALPPASRYESVRARSGGTVQPPNETPIYGQGDIEILRLPESQRYNEMQRLRAETTRGLPEPKVAKMAREAERRSVLPTNTAPIRGKGDIHTPEPLGLPEGNYVPPTRLKVADATQSLDFVMKKIKPEVVKIIEAPARRDLLVDYIQKNTGYPLREIHNMPMKDLQELGQGIQQQLQGEMERIAYDVAAKYGYDLPAIFRGEAPSIAAKQAADQSKRVVGVYPEARAVQTPSLNKRVTGTAAMPETKVGYKNLVRNQKIKQSQPETIPTKRDTETAEFKQQRLEQTTKEIERRRIISELQKPFVGVNTAVPQTKVGYRNPMPGSNAPKKPATILAPKMNQTSSKVPPLKPTGTKRIEVNPEELIKTKEPRVRDKIVSFLDEQEKAARERLKAKRNTLSSMPIDQFADHAIILAAQIGKKGIKLVDATEYLVKEFGEDVRPHAQAILNRARGVAKEAERRATKEAQDARAFNAADEGDAATFRNKVSRETKANKTPFSQKWEKIRTQFVDDLVPLEGLEKRVRGALSSAENSLYKAARLFRGVPEKANRIVKDRLAPIIEGIEKKGYTSTDLGDYALAVHSKDVNARDIMSGFTDKEIDDVIKRLGTAEMETARKEIIKLSNDLLDGLEKEGVISGDLVKALKERYPNYMPLFRNFDDEAVNFSDGLSQALANVTSPIKGLKGSKRQVIDPFESMVKNIFQSTNSAERNKVAAQLAKLAKDDKESLYIRKLDEGEEVGRKNVVSVLEGGKKVQYEVEPEVYKAMLNLDKESSNFLIKVLQKPASLLRAGATLTPEFSLRNPLRDVVQAFVTSNSGFNPLIDFPVGLIQSISKGDLYKKWIDELGAYGNIMSNDRQVHKEALERVLKESPGKKFVNVVNGKSLIRVLRAISDTTESATKVGEFRAALRQGQTPQEAAYRSRDIMDFGRAGTSIRQTNKIVAFLNANIQGKSKLIRAFKANPAGFSARAFTSITVPTIGIFLMQKYLANESQKKTIDESPAWLTDTFWLVPIPNTDQVARIPKPFDIGTLFSNLPERALKYTYNNDKEAFDGFAKKAIADGALPGMISAITPFIEGMANYSFFRGGQIIPQREEGVNFADQYDVNTTETAKGLAKAAEFVTGGKGGLKNFSSPRIMDNTIKGLTAGLGTYATSAIDVMLDKFNLTDNPSRPAKGVAQKPLAKAFLVNPNQSGKSTTKLYELKDDLTTDKGSAKLRGEPFKEGGKLDYINKQTDAMSAIGKQIREIEKSRTLNPQQKREQIDKLTKQRNEIAMQTMKRVQEN